MTTASTWAALSHDSILTAVEGVLGIKISNLLRQRNSYINRVYELEKYDSQERFIVKFYRPGRWTPEMIAEEHVFLNKLAVEEIPVIPPIQINRQTLFSLPPNPQFTPSEVEGTQISIPFSLFPKKSGRALDEFDKTSWEELGRLLARIHSLGALHKTSRRITWRPKIATKLHFEILLNSDYLLPNFKKAFNDTAECFIQKADPFFDGQEFILLHGDCHKGNLIHRPGEGIYIVDFDDLCFGPPVQDLWLLLPDTPEKCENELSWFFKGYAIFRPFDLDALKLVPLLRGMRIIHFASWLAVQSQEADFPIHFPEAGKPRYWNELIKEVQEINSRI